MAYGVRCRCGHRIRNIRRAGENGDRDRDCVPGVWACGLRRENRDYVPADQMRGKVLFTINAAGQVYKQTIEFMNLGVAITTDRDSSIEISRSLQTAWACSQRYKRETYDRPGLRLQLKVRLRKAEVIEKLLYGCMTLKPNKPNYDRLRRVHHSMLLRCLRWRKRKRDDHTLSYANALSKTGSKSIEAIMCKRRTFFCGIRSTYEGGASTTEGDAWGACWG